MYGLEINHLANLLKDCDPTRNDSDSDEEQVDRATSFCFPLIDYR